MHTVKNQDQRNGVAAFGAPGIEPRWTSTSKEGSRSSASRVRFSLSHGILNDVYFPTIDRPQIRDVQFIVTDGETFFHTEKKDLRTEICCLEERGLACGVATRKAAATLQPTCEPGR